MASLQQLHSGGGVAQDGVTSVKSLKVGVVSDALTSASAVKD